jgi:dienelactone hydrolase
MKCLTLALLCAIGAVSFSQSKPNVKGADVEYRDGSAVLQGYVAYDAARKGKRPVVLIAHDWDGLGSYEKMRANMIAKLGYLAFAVDVFGKGIRPTTTEAASAEAGKWYKDMAGLRRRMRVALDSVKKNPLADPKRIAIIGYCFGGTSALELARSGADLRGVVTFHGSLTTSNPADAKNIKAKILVLHGVADPFVTPSDVIAFEKEMRAGHVKYRIVRYPGAVHAFTIPDASKWGIAGAKYNASADKKSWEEMRQFLREVFR